MKLSQLNASLFDHLYRDIMQFRMTFDLPCEDPLSLDDKSDQLHSSLIIEELTELAQANSLIDEADAIVDSVYVLMGRVVHLGNKKLTDNLALSYLIDLFLNVAASRKINFLACWDEIHASNMSKVCRNAQEYQETQAYYEKQGVTLVDSVKGDFIIAKCAQDVQLADKLVRQGKVLKSVYYRPADLTNIVSL
ncbi:Phosphoribosyl-ATP pyrophosphohydrolase-like protein [Psychromonas sp. CNPT3]|uniref:nucleoside triphosphate pyrophosphohydrolase family protein n=1 Tax=Psychromonas sp. CNPT3 TaxID=314282 RepID=UPI00006EA476|nr:nucleoside triphosphate pyrophosphohydrolase family protein [Psychromonas sp. CNPT3]AGH82260.1 Phosphoribosyl-ATP pyrophosphohydrolase-like protein [Psychromonas sp. CNPT3]